MSLVPVILESALDKGLLAGALNVLADFDFLSNLGENMNKIIT